MGRLLRKKPNRKWTYISAETVREEEVFQIMEEYIRRRQNMVTEYIAARSLLDLCEGSERATWAQMGMRWWKQAGINLAGAREGAAAATDKDGGAE